MYTHTHPIWGNLTFVRDSTSIPHIKYYTRENGCLIVAHDDVATPLATIRPLQPKPNNLVIKIQ